MKKMSEGNFSMKMHWRKKDETKELARLIGEVIDNTKSSVIEDRKKISQAIQAIDGGDNKKAVEILESVTKWCKTESSPEDK